MPTPARKPESLSVFGDKSNPPTEDDLRRALGPAASAWDELVARIHHDHAPAAERWNFAGARFGWSLRLCRGDRVVLYLIPQAGRFLVGIVLGAKAVAAARSAGLPEAVLQALAEAPRYAEGTGLRLMVSDASQLQPIRTLAALKMA